MRFFYSVYGYFKLAHSKRQKTLQIYKIASASQKYSNLLSILLKNWRKEKIAWTRFYLQENIISGFKTVVSKMAKNGTVKITQFIGHYIDLI